MKVVVTARGPELDAAIDPRFGRAAWLQVVDTATGRHVAVNNEVNLNARQGAGVQAAQAVARQQAEALLTGHCGPKAFRVLRAAGVEVYTGLTGTVREALAEMAAERLVPADGHDVDAHWS
jgi:predicted Fe-Mo cluster-binding NifX family protein